MGNRILTDNIAGAINMPFTKRSLDFLQDSILPAFYEYIKSTIPNYETNKVYVINGFVVSEPGLVGQPYSWTDGLLFYNNEAYFVEANTIIAGVGETLILTVATNFLNTDPVTFKPDGSGSFNVHQIKTILPTNGVSGTGISDWNEIIFKEETKIFDIGAWNMQTTNEKVIDISSIFFQGSNILDISVMITDDYNVQRKLDGSDIGTFAVVGGWKIEYSNLILVRNAAGLFNSSNYSNTLINRGKVYITYKRVI